MASKPGRLGEVDPEAVTAALIFAAHFRTGMTELLLHVPLVDVGRGGKAGAAANGRRMSLSRKEGSCP